MGMLTYTFKIKDLTCVRKAKIKLSNHLISTLLKNRSKKFKLLTNLIPVTKKETNLPQGYLIRTYKQRNQN